MTKSESHSAKRKYLDAASGEEGRFLHELSRKWLPLSDTIKEIGFRYGEDSDGAPSVWITILVSADVNPSREKIHGWEVRLTGV